MNILFICKYNRFRSKVAEAFLKKYSQNKDTSIRSAGTLFYAENPNVANSVVEIMLGKGIRFDNLQSQKVNKYLIRWADKIIIVADNVDVSQFPESKVEVWTVKDASEHDILTISKRISEIEGFVLEFSKRLNL